VGCPCGWPSGSGTYREFLSLLTVSYCCQCTGVYGVATDLVTLMQRSLVLAETSTPGPNRPTSCNFQSDDTSLSFMKSTEDIIFAQISSPFATVSYVWIMCELLLVLIIITIIHLFKFEGDAENCQGQCLELWGQGRTLGPEAKAMEFGL